MQGNAINSLGNHLFEGAENLKKIEMDSNQIEKVFINALHGQRSVGEGQRCIGGSEWYVGEG